MGEKITKLQKQITKLCEGRKIIDVSITENFNKNGENVYSLHKLRFNIENKIGMFYDADNIQEWKDTSVLNGFLISSVVNDPEIDNDSLIILFKDGSISIKVTR